MRCVEARDWRFAIADWRRIRETAPRWTSRPTLLIPPPLILVSADCKGVSERQPNDLQNAESVRGVSRESRRWRFGGRLQKSDKDWPCRLARKV
jgi:hypothetical protein